MDKALLKIALTSVPGRYAHALFESAQADNAIDEVLSNFKEVETFSKNHPMVERFLFSGVLPKKELDEAWQIVGKELGFLKLFISFIRLLVQQRRLDQWQDIKKFYQLAVYQVRNYREVQVVSAYPLQTKEQTKLKNILTDLFSQDLGVRFTVDESLLSGIVVKADTLMLDMSFMTQLKSLAERLRENI